MDPYLPLITAIAPPVCALTGLIVVTLGLLKGWQDWLALRAREIDRLPPGQSTPSPAARIEVADLRERVRQLEAIAAGVEL